MLTVALALSGCALFDDDDHSGIYTQQHHDYVSWCYQKARDITGHNYDSIISVQWKPGVRKCKDRWWCLELDDGVGYRERIDGRGNLLAVTDPDGNHYPISEGSEYHDPVVHGIVHYFLNHMGVHGANEQHQWMREHGMKANNQPNYPASFK